MTTGLLIARALTETTLHTRMPLRLQPAGAREITVDATPHTTIPGTWGVRLDDGRHLRVSGSPRLEGERVRWQLAEGQELPPRAARAVWTGVAHRSPEDAGLAARDELIRTPQGSTPAWRIDPAGAGGEAWAIHVHGAGSTRAGTLRGVIAAAQAGLPSLVVTYRNSIEGPRSGRGRSHLGFTEARDVEAAMAHLSADGAERFVLFGWSMGAQTVLPMTAAAEWRDRIAGVVLDSPALDWMGILRLNLRQARLPEAFARCAAPWITSPRRSRLVGLDEPVPLPQMDWVARAAEVAAPVLIHHGTEDTSTPFADSERFVAASGDAELVRTRAGHTVGWNFDPERWTRETVRFLGRLT